MTDACPSDSSIIDFVGYGGTANCFEGSGPTPAPSTTTSVFRDNNGCTDTDDNFDDFATDTPNPRNTASPTSNCAILSGVGSANPASVATRQKFSADGQRHTRFESDQHRYHGGCRSLFDWRIVQSVVYGNGNSLFVPRHGALATPPGQKSLPVTISDAQARTANTTINLTVLQPPPSADHIVISQVYGGGGNASATF